ncbi:MAG: hypothetical protein DPW16_17415 [Chloroflexi bacterium]|nr:hypothetical protein [Chloroflexota bacterium]
MDTLGIINFTVAIISLIISLMTIWLTLLKKGNLRMTRPSVVAFAFDVEKGRKIPKIFLRTLLFSTAQQGQVIESMYVKIQEGNIVHTLTEWGYYHDSQLVLGGGLYVPHEGIASYHHFLLTGDIAEYKLSAGEYDIEIFAKLINRKSFVSLFKLHITLDKHLAETVTNKNAGVMFTWDPIRVEYNWSIDSPPKI